MNSNEKNLNQPAVIESDVSKEGQVLDETSTTRTEVGTEGNVAKVGRKASVRLRRLGKSTMVPEECRPDNDSDTVKILVDALDVARIGEYVAVVVYQDCVLTNAEESPFGKDAPSMLMFLDRFNEDTLTHPMWKALGIDVEGMYDVMPVFSEHLVTALMNRFVLENVFEEMTKCREQRVASIYEGAYPALRYLLNRHEDLPNFKVIIQSPTGNFRSLSLNKVMVLNEVLMDLGIWSKNLFGDLSDDVPQPEIESQM